MQYDSNKSEPGIPGMILFRICRDFFPDELPTPPAPSHTQTTPATYASGGTSAFYIVRGHCGIRTRMNSASTCLSSVFARSQLLLTLIDVSKEPGVFLVTINTRPAAAFRPIRQRMLPLRPIHCVISPTKYPSLTLAAYSLQRLERQRRRS